MDVSIDILGTVDLDDPIDGWEVDTTRTDVCAEQDCVLLLDKLEVNRRSLVLVHLTMEFKQILVYFQ